LKTTPVFRLLWYFAAERMKMLERRLQGLPREQWTEDPILREYRFTLPYRIADYVSQDCMRRVLYHVQRQVVSPSSTHTGPTQLLTTREPHTPREVFFRCMLYRLFNNPNTWTLLEHNALTTWEGAKGVLDSADRVLTDAQQRGERIFNPAYVQPPVERGTGKSKHRGYLELVWKMMEAGVPDELTQCQTFSGAMRVMQEKVGGKARWPIMGGTGFTAGQLLMDLDYSEAFNFRQESFPAGPGAQSGLVKCFELGEAPRSTPELSILWLTENQDRFFKQYDLDFHRLYGLPLRPSDIQNCLCEVNKYARVAHPEMSTLPGTDKTVDIKQRYTPRPGTPQVPVVPPKWLRNAAS
jgi:hypothetical protein